MRSWWSSIPWWLRVGIIVVLVALLWPSVITDIRTGGAKILNDVTNRATSGYGTNPVYTGGATTGGRREVSSPSAFAQAAEACFRRYNVYAATNADNGCYVAADTHLICTEEVDPSIPASCRGEANAAGKPGR